MRKPRRAELDVSLDDYEALLAAQGGGCALCGNPPKTRRLDVDHDHRTGQIRGLLCSRCNQAIPSERLMPRGWPLSEWGEQVGVYATGIPWRFDAGNMRRALDEINRRREDATNGRV